MEELSVADAGDGSIHWLHEGSCVGDDVEPLGPRVCFRCGKSAPPASCAKCGVAAYCDQDCQKADWGKKALFGGHKVRTRCLGGTQSRGRSPRFPPSRIARFHRATNATDPFQAACAVYKMLGRAQQLPPAEQKPIFERLLASVRLRMCPFALSQHGSRGRGLVLIQSDCTLAQLALPTPRDCSGRLEPRSVVLQYLDLEEMDEMVRWPLRESNRVT